MSDIPEFHGNPNDYDFNPEFVFNLKAENAALQAKLTAERELSGVLREALVDALDMLDSIGDLLSSSAHGKIAVMKLPLAKYNA